jgi:hypothetical protein
MTKSLILIALSVIINLSVSFGQDGLKFQEQFQALANKASSTIKIDGVLDEQTWIEAKGVGDFFMKWPNDIGRPKRQTEVKVSYDDQFIYFGIKAIDTNFHVVQTLKRDQGFFDTDAVTIAIDPVNQRTNGFLFSITPYNVQSEDQVVVASGETLSFSWDNKWYSATSRHETYWIAEIAIPFSTLRFKEGKSTWGLNMLRSDAKNNEYSTWTDMPINFMFFDFGYSGALKWDTPPPVPRTNISLIPYVTGSAEGNKEQSNSRTTIANAGFDAKVALGPALNLDLTVNPDFSQVEVDKQVTNLTRFDIFFPERRTFFLENDDLFSSFGIPPIKPFYSRSIGLDKNGNKIPILGGARISGNLTKKTRVGFMSMQTKSTEEMSAQNYTAVTFNQQVQTRSMVKGYFLNRESFEANKIAAADPFDKFGRNSGLEYIFIDKSGKWNGWAGYHASFKPLIQKPQYYASGGGGYFGKKLTFIVDAGELTDNYYADMGFVNRIENFDALLDTIIRRGFQLLYNESKYTFYPKGGRLNQIAIRLENFATLNLDGTLNERTHDLEFQFSYRNTSNLVFHFHNNINHLLFNTAFTEKTPLPPGEYMAMATGVTYSSDARKKLSMKTDIEVGEFFNGKLLRYEFSLNYRIQPWGNFTMAVQHASLAFPEPYGKNNLFLIAPRVEINFSNNLFWTTFLQYNNQRNNFNINSRLQWRYKPMSDMFLVYSDNYFTDPFMKNKNRAVVFKLNYWLNL